MPTPQRFRETGPDDQHDDPWDDGRPSRGDLEEQAENDHRASLNYR